MNDVVRINSKEEAPRATVEAALRYIDQCGEHEEVNGAFVALHTKDGGQYHGWNGHDLTTAECIGTIQFLLARLYGQHEGLSQSLNEELSDITDEERLLFTALRAVKKGEVKSLGIVWVSENDDVKWWYSKKPNGTLSLLGGLSFLQQALRNFVKGTFEEQLPK